MKTFYVPYTGEKPCLFSVKGHQLVILSSDENVYIAPGAPFRAEWLMPLYGIGSEQELEYEVMDIALAHQASVVVAPDRMSLAEVVKNLESELPWVH